MNTDRTASPGYDPEEEEIAANEAAVPLATDVLQDPRTPDAREAAKKQRRLDARNWAPRESVAVHYNDIVVGHQTIKRAWNPLFVRAQTTLYMLEGVLPSTGQLEAARGVFQTLTDRLGKLEDDLRNEMERLHTLAKNDGIKKIGEARWTDPEAITVPIYTPTAARYLRIILNVQELYWMLDYLWFQGTIKNEYKWQIVNTWKKKLWDFVKFTTQTWIRARASLQDKQHDANQRRTTKRTPSAPASNDANGADSDSAGQAAAAG